MHVFSFDGGWRGLGPATIGSEGEVDVAAETERADQIAAEIRNLPMDGGRTDLGALLRGVAGEFARSSDRHLAGVVLISDGRETGEGESPQEVLDSLGAVRENLRVQAVGLGNPDSGSNLQVTHIQAKDQVLVGDEVLFETALRHKGFTGARPVRVAMTVERIVTGPDGKRRLEPTQLRVDRRTQMSLDGITLGSEEEPTPIALRASFDEVGEFRVTIRAELPPGLREQDFVPEDDFKTHDITVEDSQIRVLYVDHQPRWDWRFLSNFLTREPPPDPQHPERRRRFLVNVLLKSADARVEQPHTRDPQIRAIRDFPRTRKELFQYDVIILGDVDIAEFGDLDAEERKKLLKLLVSFVEEGGGLAMQAGWEYRMPLAYIGTPLDQLMPIHASEDDKGISEPQVFDRAFRLELSEAGMNHPIFSIVPGEDGGVADPARIAKVWRGDTTLSEEWQWYWLYRASGGLSPGASALARVRTSGASDFVDDRGRPLVVFASMPFGKGHVFWSSLDMISRIRRQYRDLYFGGFWEQVIRYLATYRMLGGNKRVKIFPDKKEYFVGDIATITITALDSQFEPLSDAYLDGVHIESPDGETTPLKLTERPKSLAEEGELGSYRMHLPMRQQGQYRIWIERDEINPATGRTNRQRAEKRLEVLYKAREDILKVPDHETLRDIVRATNPNSPTAEVLGLHQLGTLTQELKSRPRERILDRRDRTEWDRWWVLVLIVGLLTIEWVMRKRLQMI